MKKNNYFEKVFITNSSRETQKLGRNFAKILEKGNTVCLYGDLGSGKTTFTQGLAEGLEIKNRIISPTFIIMRSHELKKGMFYHVDLYRIEGEKDVEDLGLKEIMDDRQSIVVIEWAEKLKNYLPKKRIDIKFSYISDRAREIAFSSPNQ